MMINEEVMGMDWPPDSRLFTRTSIEIPAPRGQYR